MAAEPRGRLGNKYFAGLTPKEVHIDPAIEFDASGTVKGNREQLLVNDINTWSLRPSGHTAIPNFWIAGDYLKTFTDLPCMEAANEGARRAVNALLAKLGKTGLCTLWQLPEPASLALPRAFDKVLFDAGLPWALSPF